MSDSLQKTISNLHDKGVEETRRQHENEVNEVNDRIKKEFLPELRTLFQGFLDNPKPKITESYELSGVKCYSVMLDSCDFCVYKLSQVCGFDESVAYESYYDVSGDRDKALKVLEKEAFDFLRTEFVESFEEFDWGIRISEGYESGLHIALHSHKTFRDQERERSAEKCRRVAQLAEQVENERINKEKADKLRKSTIWSVSLTVFFLVLVPVAAILLSIESGHLTPEQVLPAEWVEPVKSFFNWK